MLDIVKTLAAPILNIIDSVVEDKDKANELKNKIQSEVLSNDSEYMRSVTNIITTETKSGSWLTCNWRPITMMVFLALLVMHWLGLSPDYVVSDPKIVTSLFELLKIGIGGYILGRSAEKAVKVWKG